MKKIVLTALLLLIAMSARLYHITYNTEFLGDQGRDAIVAHEFIEEGKIPNVGPTVGAGNYTGPFYYYLITPAFFLFRSNPVGAAVEMVVISVAAIFLFLTIATSLYNFPIAYGVSVLWALSPLMIIQDRRLWNPTPIPFFVLLLIGSLVWIIKDRKYWGFLTAALAAAALIQLHYVNGISIFLAGLCFIDILYQLFKQKKGKIILPWLITGVVLFVTVLYPFISYEIQHQFKDVLGSLMTLSLKDGQLFSKRLYVNTFINICSGLSSYIVAMPWNGPLYAISLVLFMGNLIQRRTVSYILIAWLGLGIASLSFYKDAFQPQYAYQFIPIVFLMLGGVLSDIRKSIRFPIICVCVVTATITSWFFINPYATADPDIPRITALTSTTLLKVGSQSFAFTVVNSRSFTDFHMRYFFLKRDAHLVPVDDSTNKTLVVLCEGDCPQEPLTGKISVMCHTELCPLDKPDIRLADWGNGLVYTLGSSAVYIYTR